ncbi:MAG: glycosyltransferase family 2 protein [Paracoccaceae bacterium]
MVSTFSDAALTSSWLGKPSAQQDVIEENIVRAPVADPKLAIVVTCYNYRQFIKAAIDSVVEQQRDDCEIIVVDDGSTDGSWHVIAQSGVNGVRIRNRGQVGACLVGLKRTMAPFVLFLDADDMLKPGSLGRIIALLDEGIAKLQFPLTRIDRAGDVIGPALPALEDFRDRSGLAAEVLRSGTYVSPPTSGNVFRRDVCALLSEVDYDHGVDGVILFAAPFFGDVVSLSEELGCYRVHATNMSGQGRGPTAEGIRKDLKCFTQRMEHLRRIVGRMSHGQQLARTEDMYFFIERELCAKIATGSRLAAQDVTRMIAAIRRQDWPLKSKCAMAVFFLLTTAVRPERAMNLMAYRFKFGPRSVRGFVSALIMKP